MARNKSNGAGIVLAGLIGGLIGAAVGLMLAPKPGKELRRDVAVEGRELLNDLQRLLEEIGRDPGPINEDIPNVTPKTGENDGTIQF